MQSKRTLVLPTLGAAAAVIAIIGISNFADRDEVVYCVDNDNKVADETKCDDSTGGYGFNGGSSFWYMIGRYAPNQPVGTQLDATKATQRVPFNDPAARTKAGLSATGKVGSGKVISGKAGGFGGSSSSSHNGFGG